MIFSKAAISTGRSSSSACAVSPVQAQFRDSWKYCRARISLAHTTSCAGFSATSRNSNSGGTASHASRRLLARRRNLREDQRRWTYLYRGRQRGKDRRFLLRAKRDVAAAKAFFRRRLRARRLRAPSRLMGTKRPSAAREILGEHRRGKRTQTDVFDKTFRIAWRDSFCFQLMPRDFHRDGRQGSDARSEVKAAESHSARCAAWP